MVSPGPAARDGALGEVEAWFLARGVPHLIDGYSATRDVFTRAVPVLTLIVALEVFGAANLEWPWWANVLAVLGGLAALLGAWALANRLRGRASFARPDNVGAAELATFVLAPALLPLIFGGDAEAAAWTFGANAGLLVVIYLVTSYGLVPLTRWAAVQTVRQLGSVVSLTVRALPLLLVFGVVLIVNTEVWQMSSSLDTVSLVALVALFVVLGTGLLLIRIPREVHGLEVWDGPDDLRRRVAGTPAEHLGNAEACTEPPPLRRRHWANLGLVLLFGQGLQVLLVAVAVGAFFAGFGALAITPETAESWTGTGLDRLLTVNLGERDVVLSAELVKVSVFLAAFSGLYFAVNAATDDSFRREFVDDVLHDLRQVLAVRTAYLTALSAGRSTG